MTAPAVPTTRRRAALLAAGMAGTAVAWTASFPRDPRLVFTDIATEASYCVAVFAGYLLIRRPHIRVLEIGWLLFLWSLLLELLDEFTIESAFWNDQVTAALGIPGLVLLGVGFARAAAAQREAEAERRRVEAEVRAARDAAERALEQMAETARARDDVVSIVSHDFRSPLTLILGYAEALLEKAKDPETRALLSLMATQARQLARLAEATLTMSRVDAGTLVLDRGQVPLDELVREAIAARAHASVPAAATVAAEGVDALTIEGDGARLRQVLQNLLDNALKFSPRGGRVKVALRAADGGALLTVSDEGPGIAAEDVPQLFRRYVRLGDPARTQGSGLGLFICRSIVEAHGGRVAVESGAGGSTFTVWLPARPPGGNAGGAVAPPTLG